MSRREKQKTIIVSTRVTQKMQERLQEILLTASHLNTAEYVRDLIRKDMERRGLLEAM